MKRNTKNVPAGLGSVEPTVPSEDITAEKLQEYLKNDLQIAIACLDAIYRDPDLLIAISQFMHGRFMNHRAAKELAELKQKQESAFKDSL